MDHDYEDARPAVEALIERIAAADSAGDAATGLDLVFDWCDTKAREGRFKAIDLLLRTVNVEHLVSTHILYGLLTATYPMRADLDARAQLAEEVVDRLRSLGLTPDVISSLGAVP